MALQVLQFNGANLQFNGADLVFGSSDAVLGPRVCDVGLSALTDECNRLVLCSQEPTTFTEANVTYMLAHKTVTLPGAHIFSAAADDPTGRKVSLIQIFDGTVAADGTPTHWAAVDTANSRLLLRSSLAVQWPITTASQFAMAPFDVTFNTQAAAAA